jgi:hypothetical protein
MGTSPFLVDSLVGASVLVTTSEFNVERLLAILHEPHSAVSFHKAFVQQDGLKAVIAATAILQRDDPDDEKYLLITGTKEKVSGPLTVRDFENGWFILGLAAGLTVRDATLVKSAKPLSGMDRREYAIPFSSGVAVIQGSPYKNQTLVVRR